MPPKKKTTTETTTPAKLSDVYVDLSDEKAFKRVRLESMIGNEYIWHTFEPRKGDNGDYMVVLVENGNGDKAVVMTAAYRVIQKLTQLAASNHLPASAKLVKSGQSFDLV